MCGIFGYIGTGADWDKTFRLLSALAIATESRGEHATGYAALNGTFHYAKAPLPAREFIRTDDWLDLGVYGAQAVVGHCRYATQGAWKDNRNNHPFVGPRFALVHNGVLTGHRLIAAREGVDLKSECDSEVLLRIIEKRGVEKGARRLFDSVLGGFNRSAAVAVLEPKRRALRLFRSNDRPLYIVRTSEIDGGAVFFASTPEIMEASMRAAFGRVLHTTSAFSAMPGRLYTLTSRNGSAPLIESADVCDRSAFFASATVDLRKTAGRLDHWALESEKYSRAIAPTRTAPLPWEAFACGRCGTQTLHHHTVRSCPHCGGPAEPLKRCHDCSAWIPSTGPGRCEPCLERHRERERKRRRTKRSKGTGVFPEFADYVAEGKGARG